MSRFGNTQYQASGSNNQSADYKDRDSFLMSRYAIVEATLANVGVYPGNYGQNIILSMDDVEVLEGVIGRRLDDEKLKVFGWDKWFNRDGETMELEPLPGQDSVSEGALPEVESTSAGGNTFRYNIEEAVMEGRDEPVPVGDLEMWLKNSKKARTMAKVFSEHGHDIINEDNTREDYGWMDAENRSEFNFRDDLEGRRIIFWFENKTIPADKLGEDQNEDITFTDSVILDAETEAGITIKNGETSDSAGTSSDVEEEADEEADDEAEFPADIQSLVDMFARTGQDNRESVESMVRDAAPNGYEVDMDAVMAAIEAGT